MEKLEAALIEAMEAAVVNTLAARVADIAAKETQRQLADHDDELARLVKASVAAALAKLLH